MNLPAGKNIPRLRHIISFEVIAKKEIFYWCLLFQVLMAKIFICRGVDSATGMEEYIFYFHFI